MLLPMTIMTLTANAIITAIMAIPAIMAITANLFITVTIAITTNIEKVIDVAAITIFRCDSISRNTLYTGH